MSESTSAWLSVAEAAARLGISERAIQKRCSAGKIEARRITTPQGTRWEIEASALHELAPERTREPANARTNELAPEPGREPANPANDSQATHVQNHPNARTEPAPEPAPEPNRTPEREAELKEEVLFLRGVIEAQNRDAAELRAALREALKMSNRALVESTSPGVDASSVEQLEPLKKEASVPSSKSTSAAPIEGTGRGTPAQSTFERSKGLRAWLLKILRG